MLAGGTGVTPMYQVLNAILKNTADKTKVGHNTADQGGARYGKGGASVEAMGPALEVSRVSRCLFGILSGKQRLQTEKHMTVELGIEEVGQRVCVVCAGQIGVCSACLLA